MDIKGSICLRISGEKLDFGSISSSINIKPTDIYKKGDTKKYGKSIFQSKSDSWIYEIEFGEGEEPNNVLENLLDILIQSKECIKGLSEMLDIRIRCYLSSDYGQMYAIFSPKVIQDMADLNVKFEISILSFGGVEE